MPGEMSVAFAQDGLVQGYVSCEDKTSRAVGQLLISSFASSTEFL